MTLTVTVSVPGSADVQLRRETVLLLALASRCWMTSRASVHDCLPEEPPSMPNDFGSSSARRTPLDRSGQHSGRRERRDPIHVFAL
jgi:hypothetical protein